MAEQQLHVVMLPWSAFGHMIPFLQLSIALAKHGVRVTYVSTPNNIKRLPNIPSNLASLITLVALPMPELQNGDLPKGAEATVDIPFEKLPLLNVAYDLLQYPFQKLVADQSPDWIIIDFMPHWVIEIGKQHKIPVMHFSVYSAAVATFTGPPEYIIGEGRERVKPSMESLMSPPNWVDFPSSVAFKKHEAIPTFPFLYGLISNGTNFSLAERIAKILKDTQAISYRTCNEFEGQHVNLLRKLLKKPIIPTGLLPLDKPEEGKYDSIDHHEGSWNQIFKWLDEQKPKSTVFVGFGSECKFTKDQIHEIAYGLELSELPFLWALRKPEWANDEDEIEVLPHGFGEGTKGKGVVKLGWAPQKEILGHSSIGGSLFHSGWGSVIEILQFGHCLVVLPMIYDQGLMARLVVEKGLAGEVNRSEDGSFNRHDIAKALRTSMVSKEGEPLRTRAREAATIFGDMKLHQEHYIGELVNFLKSHKA